MGLKSIPEATDKEPQKTKFEYATDPKIKPSTNTIANKCLLTRAHLKSTYVPEINSLLQLSKYSISTLQNSMSLQIYPNYAWIEYLDGTNEARKVRQTIENNDETYTCAVTLAEVVSKIARMGKDPKTAYDILLSNSQLVSVDEEFSLQAGLLQVEMRKTEKDFGLADAYILAAARNIKAKIITGDPHFKSIEDAIMIK